MPVRIFPSKPFQYNWGKQNYDPNMVLPKDLGFGEERDFNLAGPDKNTTENMPKHKDLLDEQSQIQLLPVLNLFRQLMLLKGQGI